MAEGSCTIVRAVVVVTVPVERNVLVAVSFYLAWTRTSAAERLDPTRWTTSYASNPEKTGQL